MAIKQHEPLDSTPELLSEDKRKWFSSLHSTIDSLAQSRLFVFQTAMNATPRPTQPDESIAFGYMRLNKFHDREPEKIVESIELIDKDFFNSYPRREGTLLDLQFKKQVVSEAARTFYKFGLASYGKPKLRKESKENLNEV